jgi:hypothetical protein
MPVRTRKVYYCSNSSEDDAPISIKSSKISGKSYSGAAVPTPTRFPPYDSKDSHCSELSLPPSKAGGFGYSSDCGFVATVSKSVTAVSTRARRANTTALRLEEKILSVVDSTPFLAVATRVKTR